MKDDDNEVLFESIEWRLISDRAREWFGSIVGSISCLLVLYAFILNNNDLVLGLLIFLPVTIVVVIVMLVPAALIGVALTHFFYGRIFPSVVAIFFVVPGVYLVFLKVWNW